MSDAAESQDRQPNILWVVTDDQRADSIAAFNQIRQGRSRSELGHVLSPNVDRLAAMGTTFINTFNQNPGCAPSRTLMLTGRYSHRTGVYGFEYYNPTGQAHWRPMTPEVLRDEAGYQTLSVGKLGCRAQHFKSKRRGTAPPLYETNLGYRNEFAAKGMVDWHAVRAWANGGPLPKNEIFYLPDGSELVWPELADGIPNDRAAITEKFDLLRKYSPGDDTRGDDDMGMILGGVNPQPGDRTRDGSFTKALLDHLDHADEDYTDMLDRHQTGPDSGKPLFAYVGYEFPHTPVLPPAEFREKFEQLKYEIPTLSEEELAAFPPQLVKLFKNSGTDHFTDAEKHQMLVDYYAFCAYGDSLVGQAADGFIEFSERQGRPWMILYVCGDHGWRLNEHGMVSKFSHYDTDLHNPIIVVSSDKQKFPAGKVVEDFTEFVDMAPTFLAAGGVDISAPEYDYLDGRNLAETASGTVTPRDYIIAEPTWVIGPRAVIRTKDYKFAMKIRPRTGHAMTKATAGKDFQWAVTADLKDIEPTLFDLRTDPDEIHNVAFDDRYRPALDALRTKLQDIVLGDGRVEIAWTKEGKNLPAFISNFALGANDGRLELPDVGSATVNETARETKWRVAQSDEFSRAALGNDYVVKANSAPGWTVGNGILVGRQTRDEHGAVIRRMLDFGDANCELRFRFASQKGWSRFNLVFDDSNEKSVHSGHISRVSVSRREVVLSDDKAGSMNNEVRKLRKLASRTAEQQTLLDETLERTTRSVRVDLSDAEWHDLRVTIVGSKMSVELDGKPIATLDSPGNDHQTRNKYGFTVTGQSIEFDDLRVAVPVN